MIGRRAFGRIFASVAAGAPALRRAADAAAFPVTGPGVSMGYSNPEQPVRAAPEWLSKLRSRWWRERAHTQYRIGAIDFDLATLHSVSIGYRIHLQRLRDRDSQRRADLIDAAAETLRNGGGVDPVALAAMVLRR